MIESMKGNKGEDIYNRTGIMASSISENRYLKYCLVCANEDKKEYGELFWHRVHQIPCLQICPKHKTLLLDSEVLVHSGNKHEFIGATNENCCITGGNINNSISYQQKVLDRMIVLANNVEKLLKNKYSNRPLNWFQEQYVTKLKEMGLVNINGKVKYKELLNSFIEYHGKEFLELGYNKEITSQFSEK
ncbi:hypothetical protein CLTEP_08880 [Clostridium tepidiprofundi DSM 19306]|uniref:Uncharacterized protein n=1 Tax=Clostridium tepidiprofundi DSM 19306 TaxID=1121338 RepID=A0A151B633_9CLOT|nr:hypothetical protein CLTEP_08880 [Clostridium tepidiprofundi DSM 19306]